MGGGRPRHESMAVKDLEQCKFSLLQTMYRSPVMELFRLSGRGKDPVKTCCGRGKNVVNTAWTY
jgi:hypothetical protein